MATLKEWLKEISLPVYILVILFGTSSWMTVNGVWVELPLLVQELPEGWDLPSYLVIIIQVANIGPFIYTILTHLAPRKIKEVPVIYVLLVTGAVCCVLLAQCWWVTASIFGEEHSVALIALTAALSLAACSSSVVYLPYLAVLRPQYITAFYLGNSIGGLLPAMVGLAQNVGDDPTCVNTSVLVWDPINATNYTEYHMETELEEPRFSIQVFFYFVFGMVVLSGAAFTLLHFHPYSARAKVSSPSSYTVQSGKEKSPGSDKGCGVSVISIHALGDTDVYGVTEHETTSDKTNIKDTIHQNGTNHLKFHGAQDIAQDTDEETKDVVDGDDMKLSSREFGLLLVICAVVSGLTNGVLPSLQSYACLPYGALAYSLAVRLSRAATPLACLTVLIATVTSVTLTGVLCLTCVGLAAFQVYLATQSPGPPLQHSDSGVVMVVLTSVMLAALLSFTRVSVSSSVRVSHGRRGLLWVGVATQCGSFVGAVISFVCLTETDVFTSIPACPQTE